MASHQRPDRCQHPTTRSAYSKDSSCIQRGVHRCLKGADGEHNVLNAVAVTNTGTIEATGGSTLVIEAGSLTNNGNLSASGGTLTISNAITGTGTAVMSESNSILEFATTSAQSVTFASGAQGILKLDAAPSYTGSIAGLAPATRLTCRTLRSPATPSSRA